MTIFKKENKNLTVFLICLAISSSIWLSMSLSRTYEKTYTFPVIFKNISVSKKIESNNIIIQTKISVSGWDLLTKNIKDRTVFIDLNNYPNENSLNFSNTKNIINENFNDLKIIETIPSFFTINFEKLITKKVPLKLNIKSKLPSNYFFNNNVTTIPDSIEISGSKENLSKIKYLETEEVIISKDDTTKNKINLILPFEIKANTTYIKAFFEIEEFAETEYIVPINIENKPENIDLVFYPDKITIKCLIPFSEYKKIMPSDFYISVDFNKFENSIESSAFISLKKSPINARNIQLEKDKIEFIIYSN